jgi:hypothetical protein
MDATAVYRKTPKGEEEVKTRGARLPQKLRTLLILTDGTKKLAELQEVAKRLGIAADSLGTLEAQGLIERAAPAGAAPVAATGGDEVQRFQAAQRFMNDTVVNALGIRSFFFVLKLEKCGTRAELREILDGYGKAIEKGAGAAEAAVLAEHARALLA